MHIEDQEGFKAWLTTTLEPRCDADPAALAKYVLALVKKDRPIAELRVCMIEQLDVFLQQETKSFVELLFDKLETQCFSKPAVSLSPSAAMTSGPGVKAAPLAAALPNPAATKLPESFPTQPVMSELPMAYQPANGTVAKRKSESECDRDKDKLKYRRSRSRSWERNRRSRSRSRSRELRRERDRSRAYRNKSPPPRVGRGKRRSRSKSPGAMATGRHSRSRSPNLGRRGRYRNRSPPASRSRSPGDKPVSGGGTPTQDSNHGDVDMRLSTTSQSIQSVISAAKTHEPVKQLAAKRRCRDFDEKGYCMRGDLCPFDHGNDPVVLEDVALSSVLTFDQQGPPQGPLQPVNMEYNPSLPSMDARNMMMWNRPPQQQQPQHPQHMQQQQYRRPPPARMPAYMGGRMPAYHQRHPPPQLPQQMQMQGNHGRELIAVPVQEQHFNQDGGGRRGGGRMNNYDVFYRLGGRGHQKLPSQNCSLELKKVPRGLNSISHLNNHFAKFGKIASIQVNFNGDAESALVTFSSHAEANAAYRSTEAVLNNRFIKVFWHNAPAQPESKPAEQEPVSRQPVKERLGQPVQREPNQDAEPELLDKVVLGGSTLTKTVYIPTQLAKHEPTAQEAATAKANSLAAIKNSQSMLEARVNLKKMQMEKQKEALKLNVNLRQRKTELLARQLTQQRQLIGRLEKTEAGPQRDTLVKTVKTLQESIEKLKRETANPAAAKLQLNKAAVGPTKTDVLATKTKEEAERELLDLELEMITSQGADTTQLEHRILQLKLLAQGGAKGSRGRGRGHSTYRGRGRGGVLMSHSCVDHRTTKVLVSGYENDDKVEVIQHFSQFGEVVNYLCDDATPSVILNYKTRKEAETALLKGKAFQDRTLSITWCSNQPGQRGHLSIAGHRGRSVEEVEGLQSLEGGEEGPEEENSAFNEDLLLQDDEEEEEDEEEKSWRR